MADTGSGLTGGVDAVEHIGRQLYAQAISGASQLAHGAAGAAGSLESEVGESAFAHAIKDGRRPPDSTWQHLDSWYEFHAGLHQDLNEAIETSKNTYAPRFAQALQGQAGEALQAKLRENHQLWATHADLHQAAALASYQASAIVQNAQAEIDRIAEDGEKEFHDAVQRRDPLGALQVWRTYSGQADGVVSETAPKVGRVLQEAGFAVPLDTPLDGSTPQNKQSDPTGHPTAKDVSHGDGTDPEARQTDPNDPNPPPATPDANGSPLPTDTPNNRQTLAPGPLAPQMPTMTAPQMSSGGGGRMPSFDSGFASQMGSIEGGMGAGTSPVLAMPTPNFPGGGAVSPASAPPLADAGSNFQSGLASGLGATGGMTAAPVTTPAQPPQPLASTQPPVAAPGAGVVGMGPAGVGPGSGWTAQPVDSAGVGGHGTGGTPIAGGGGMMPTAGMAAQPLAPYSPPGAGVPSGGSGVPSAPTSPPGGTSAGGGSAGVGSGPGAGGPGAPPMLTGNPGSSGAMSALAGSSSDVNPDLPTAQRILGELAHGSEASRMLVLWAVVVLRSPVGTHIAVANNVGGGGYLPATVYLPSTVRLAVSDPALPMGWADVWMGCQFPSKILVDYGDQLTKVIAGAYVSVLVTTELWAGPPHGFAGDFVGMDHRDALQVGERATEIGCGTPASASGPRSGTIPMRQRPGSRW